MLKEIKNWEEDFKTGKNPTNGEDLTELGKVQFKKEISGFNTEIKRFKTGVFQNVSGKEVAGLNFVCLKIFGKVIAGEVRFV